MSGFYEMDGSCSRIESSGCFMPINTLRTGDVDLRF